MSDANPQQLRLLPKLVIGLAALLIVAGVLWYGITMEVVFGILRNLINRPSEPMRFRFMLQPAMAVIAAIHHGIKDAKTGRSPYFWTMLHNPEKRAGRLREGLNATARIILLGIAMDAVYQIIVLKTFYPVEALLIGLLLAFVPYVVMRGLAARAARRWYRDVSARQIR
jgi:hypothetical protein